MPPIPPSPSPSSPHRIIIYYQTHHTPLGEPISILPLLHPKPLVTHIILAAIHLNAALSSSQTILYINDHPPHFPRYDELWGELREAKRAGVKVMGLLGGAAAGTFTRLDLDSISFELYYGALHAFIVERGLDGLDLDVEEKMSLPGILRLIDRLKKDFGQEFIITLAPVCQAMIYDDDDHNLSGFSYPTLETLRAPDIAWYNTQFYCGWGDLSQPESVSSIFSAGWDPRRIVIGMVTNPENCRGWVQEELLQEVLVTLRERHGELAGVMGWEYFNSLPGGRERPWEWAEWMGRSVRGGIEELKVEIEDRRAAREKKRAEEEEEKELEQARTLLEKSALNDGDTS